MATSFPTSLDSYTRPTASDTMATTNVDGLTVVDNLYDSVEALEAKVGVNSSAVDTSLDYLVKNASSSNPGHRHTLSHGASDVTASAAELNKLDGATVTTSEINILDGVTSNATEINYLDGITLGTATASKVLSLDSNKDIDGLGTINFDNDEAITFDDSGGTARDALSLTSSDVLEVGDGANMEVGLNIMSKCLLILSAAQTISNSTFTKIQFDTEIFDGGGDYDTTNHRFTAPVTGYYRIDMSLRYVNGDVGDEKATLVQPYVNGSAYPTNGDMTGYDIVSGANSLANPRVSGLVYAEAGQYIECYTWHNAGANADVDGQTYGTYMSIYLHSI